LAKITSVSNVGIFVTDQKRARDFYTKKLGLKVVGGMPEWGYLELAVKKGAKDAVLNLWTPKAWGLTAKEAKKRVGGITGVAFEAPNFDATVAAIKRRGAKVDVWQEEEEGWKMATVWDPDGNGIFIATGSGRASGRAGLSRMSFVTISSRNASRTGGFFVKALGMKKEGGEYASYSFGRGGTALMPFTPKRGNYESAAAYKADVAAIGEDTAIMMATDGAAAIEKQLRRKRVKFEAPMAKQDWGGVSGNFFDPDGNKYMLFEPRQP
jgi:catechol 2,3-dioxygenase-like lactoylglutathione lyase family enzyme